MSVALMSRLLQAKYKIPVDWFLFLKTCLVIETGKSSPFKNTLQQEPGFNSIDSRLTKCPRPLSSGDNATKRLPLRAMMKSFLTQRLMYCIFSLLLNQLWTMKPSPASPINMVNSTLSISPSPATKTPPTSVPLGSFVPIKIFPVSLVVISWCKANAHPNQTQSIR